MKGPLIWVVEDDADARQTMVRQLEKNGFAVVSFDTGDKAYAALPSQSPPSLIVIDILLAGMSGVDLIRLLKQNQVWKDVPVVVACVQSRQDSPSADGVNASWVNP